MSARLHDNDINVNVELRKKQAEDIKNNGVTKIRTENDLKLEQKLKQEENYDERYDKAFLERYQKLGLDTNMVFMTYHPRKLKTVGGKKDVVKIIKSLYALYHHMLLDIGEIRKVEKSGVSKGGINIESLK